MPLTGSTRVSRNPPVRPTGVAYTSVEPSGFAIETRAEQQLDVPIVTLLIVRAIRRPAVPENERTAF